MVTDNQRNGFQPNPGQRLMLAGALLAAVSLSTLHAGLGAQDEERTGNTESAIKSRAALKDKQLDVALDARDIERVLSKLKRASDLSKERITNAAEVAESASGALERGDSKSARENAEQAAAMFQEIAKQLEALLAEETPQRLAAAQNLAQQLSQAERQFLRQFPGATAFSNGVGKGDPQPKTNQGKRGTGGTARPRNQENKSGTGGKKEGDDKSNKEGKELPSAGDQKREKDGSETDEDKLPSTSDKTDKGKPEEEGNNGTPSEGKDKEGKRGDGKQGEAKERNAGEGAGDNNDMQTDEEIRAALAQRAEQLAESGKTLNDLLQTILQSTDPADAEAARLVEAILKETNLSEAVANMQRVAGTIESGNLDDARLASLDVADRLEIASQRLGSAYRLIVAPQAEELRDIEKALSLLREKLEQLETPSQVAAWQRETRELLDRLEKLGIDDELREQLLEVMKRDGLSSAPAQNVAGWGFVDGRYVAPLTYRQAIINLQEEVQARLQSLLLGDLESSPDDATPPKYKDLVERYYQVLSRDSGRRKGTKSAPTSDKK